MTALQSPYANLITLVLMGFGQAASWASDVENVPTAEVPESSTIYSREELSRYDVANAEDLLRRLPGGARLLEEASQMAEKRGLGDNEDLVLINGERLASKSNDIGNYLRQVPKEAVAQVEFISGRRPGGLMANVVLLEGKIAAAIGNWRSDLYVSDYGYVTVGGMLAYAGTAGEWSYRIGGSVDRFGTSDSGWADRTRYETFADADGRPFEERPQRWSKRRTLYQSTATVERQGKDGSKLGLNALLATSDFTEDANTDVIRLDADGRVSGIGKEFVYKRLLDPTDYEISASYAKPISSRFALDILALHVHDEQPLTQERWSRGSCTNVGSSARELSKNLTDTLAEESIVRTTLSWEHSDNSMAAIGIEVAKNRLTQDLEVFLDQDGDGIAEQIFFPTANAIVEELRIEPFVRWSTTNDRWSLKSWLVGEYSSVQHNFEFAPRPSYQYLKPRLLATFDIDDDKMLQLVLERRIGQLDLTEFVPAFDFHDSEIEPGNPNLEPERILVAEVGLVYRLAGGGGDIEARTFYHHYANHIDKKVIGEDTSGNLVSANGDIGPADLYGGEVQIGIQLEEFGLNGQLLDARYRRNFSSTRDGFTQDDRGMREVYESELMFRFRHDINTIGLGYEIRYLDRNGALPEHELSNFTQTWSGPVLDAEIEKLLGRGGLSVILAGYGLLGNSEYRERLLYANNAIDGTVSRRERYWEERDRRFILSLRGTF